MPEDIPARTLFGGQAPLTAWVPSGPAAHKFAMLSGILAAMVAALISCQHWAMAALMIVPVLLLSAMENEQFLLLAIFLFPLGWSLKDEGLLHDIPGAVRLVMVIGFFLGRGLRRSLNLRQLLHPWPARMSLAFVIVAAASVVLTKPGWTYLSGHALYRLASYIGFFFLISAWADSEERVKKICLVLVYSTIVAALFAIFQEFVQGYTRLWIYLNPPDDTFIDWNGRATSFLGYPNSLAGYLNLLLPLCLAMCIVGPGKWKRVALWACPLGIIALLSTQSVGGLVAFGATLVLAILKFGRTRREKVALILGFCTLICVVFVARSVINPAHTEESSSSSALIRLVLWSLAWKFFAGSPLLGIGWGNFVGLYGSYTTSLSTWIPANVFAVHNIYLQLLAETGLAGLLTFLGLMIVSWRTASHCMRLTTDCIAVVSAFALQGAILSVLVHGWVDFLFQVSTQFGVLFWTLMGLVAVSARNRANGGGPTPSRQLSS